MAAGSGSPGPGTRSSDGSTAGWRGSPSTGPTPATPSRRPCATRWWSGWTRRRRTWRCGWSCSPAPARRASARGPTSARRVPAPPGPTVHRTRAVGDAARLIRTGWQRLVTAVLDCEKPVIAAVNATAAGGGMHLALACDLVLAAEEATFIEVFVRRGIAPDAGGAYLLARLVGPQKAKELFFFGDDVPAREAERIGPGQQGGAPGRPGPRGGDVGRPTGRRPHQGGRCGQVPDQPGARHRPGHRAVGRGRGPGAGHRDRGLPGGPDRLRRTATSDSSGAGRRARGRWGGAAGSGTGA